MDFALKTCKYEALAGAWDSGLRKGRHFQGCFVCIGSGQGCFHHERKGAKAKMRGRTGI